MAAIFANGLIQNTANWNFFCDESEWVLDPNVPSTVKQGEYYPKIPLNSNFHHHETISDS